MSTWRDIAKPIIAKVLYENAGCSEKQIRKALREAYPFGERAMWPYKVWLDEIKRQTGEKARTEAQRAGQVDWCEQTGERR